MKIKIQYLLWWFAPLIAHAIYQLIAHSWRIYVLYDLAENIAFVLIILLFISLFNNQKWQKILSKIAYVFFLLTLLFEGLYYEIFATYFSSSALFVFLETNTAEAVEFSETYFHPGMLLNIIITILLIIGFLYRSTISRINLIFKQPLLIKILLMGLLAFFIKSSGYIIANVPYAILHASYEYYQEQQKMQAYQVDQPEGNFENVKTKNSKEQQLFVLVVGESSTRRHFGIYGYPRATTPNFQKREDELLVYSDVVSTSATTIQSLKKALTLNNFKDPKEESTLIQLMNQAGFETYWISNQKPVGIYDSFVTQMAKAADHYTFKNTTIYSSVTPLDEKLLPDYKNALQSQADKVFIVVHLLATHAKYHYRYPKKFAHFNAEKTPSRFQDKTAQKTVNDYDNAIRYVDYLVGEMTDQLAEKPANSYLLYFSDHGDEVYDSRAFKGHNDDNPTPSMFEIPFVLWQSKVHQKQLNMTKDTARAATIDNLIYSMSDLSGVHFKRFEEQKSIFAKNYQEPKKRILGSHKDEYQELIKKN